MAGTFVAGTIAQGQIPSALSPIFTVPAASFAYLKFFNLYSNAPAPQTVVIFIVQSGQPPRRWRRILLTPDQSYDVLEDDRSLELAAGDSLQAITTDGSLVDFYISGVIET